MMTCSLKTKAGNVCGKRRVLGKGGMGDGWVGGREGGGNGVGCGGTKPGRRQRQEVRGAGDGRGRATGGETKDTESPWNRTLVERGDTMTQWIAVRHVLVRNTNKLSGFSEQITPGREE